MTLMEENGGENLRNWITCKKLLFSERLLNTDLRKNIASLSYISFLKKIMIILEKVYRSYFIVHHCIFLHLKMTILVNSKFGNKIVITLYAVESFQLYGYFQLACTLSFQKIYICPKKIINAKKLFKKFDFGTQLSHEIFKISNSNFSHVIYN
jgi:hypothetical protein